MEKNWLSVHIFYYGDQNYLLVHCIAPLIDDLRERGLVEHYFFIKYWIEGLHIRLRLLPTKGADEEQIKHLAGLAISAFLKQHPAFYIPKQDMFATSLSKKMFVLEYGEEKWTEIYGKEDSMPLRPNNSFLFTEYEPEYIRYGGPEGVALAEWHFEHSSDTVLSLLREINVGVQTILLGRSIQLTLPFYYGIFGEDDKVLLALDRYMSYWERWHQQGVPEQAFAKKYQRMAPVLQQRVAKIRDYMLEKEVSGQLTEVERKWKEHISEFRLEVARLYEQRKLAIPYRGTLNQEGVLTDSPDTLLNAYYYLQGSYVHMTNNRLGVTIPQEVYVAYLLKHALNDLLVGEAKV